MAKKKGPVAEQPPADRHKPNMNIRIPRPFADQLEKLADRNLSSPTEEVRRAVREYLERQGLWPPPKNGDGGGEGEV